MTTTYQRQIRNLDLQGIETLAASMLRHLNTPLVIGLTGTLGAGKTSLVQAIARHAGIDTADVTSPTFTLLQTHRGSRTIHHLDAYRVADDDEFLELGVEELFEDGGAWTLIEWADRVREVMPPEALWIRIDIEADAQLRSVTLETGNSQLVDRIDKIVADPELCKAQDR